MGKDFLKYLTHWGYNPEDRTGWITSSGLNFDRWPTQRAVR